MAGRHHIEPLEWVGLFAGAWLVEIFVRVGKLRRKLRDEFGADFVTTRSDGWADGGEKIAGIGFAVGVELSDGFFEYASERTPPTGMYGSDRAVFGIN